jgi:hypothetical protein
MSTAICFVGAAVCFVLAVTSPYSGQQTFAWAMGTFLAGVGSGFVLRDIRHT